MQSPPPRTPPTVALVSFRLGLADGVSIVAGTWRRALEAIGFATFTVAGEGPVDVVVPGLAIDAPAAPSIAELEAVFATADLVVVENLLSIPLNLPASRAVSAARSGLPTLLHHHDPPWQRARFTHITELPPDDPAWRHCVINRLTAAEMVDRGIEATVIYNGFDPDPGPSDRAGTRARLGFTDDEIVVCHPVRAIARKNIPQALRLAAELDATYWLLGQPEEDYDAELARLLTDAPCRVVHQSIDRVDDIYASADLVAFPSVWEGFGNPPIEAAFHRKPVAVGSYAVGRELRSLGFHWFDDDDYPAIRAFLDHPDQTMLDTNQAVARRHFSQDAMTRQLRTLLDAAGWLP